MSQSQISTCVSPDYILGRPAGSSLLACCFFGGHNQDSRLTNCAFLKMVKKQQHSNKLFKIQLNGPLFSGLGAAVTLSGGTNSLPQHLIMGSCVPLALALVVL